MKFSLRTFLIVAAVVGIAVGSFGRLYFTHPMIFMNVLMLLSTTLPFLLAIVTIVWIGVRRRPAWSAPICGSCKYDLRRTDPNLVTHCPKCGADLTEAKAVQFMQRRRRRWGLIAWGTMLLLMPLAGIGLLFVVQPFIGSGPSGLGNVSTPQLIQKRLPTQVDQPWVWSELETRLSAKELSQQDVDNAIKQLIAHMKTTRPNGWDKPLHWQDDFLKAAIQAKMVSDSVLFALCDAFYGPKPVIQPTPRVREGEGRFAIKIEYGSPWGDRFGSEVVLLWQVNRVLLDGKPFDVRRTHKDPDSWSGDFQGSFEPGDHEITVEVECAYIDKVKLIGLNTGNLPKERWPKARKRWKQTASAPLKVYPKGAPIVALITDSSRDPQRGGGIQIERFVVHADRDGKKKLVLRTAFPGGLSVPVSCDVTAALEGQTVELGRLWVVQKQNGQASTGSQLTARIDALDASIKDADIILTPNPTHIEDRPDVSEIWGEKIIFTAVPIERLDLDVGQEAEGP